MRAAPASIDTISTSANQEDHVSMAAHGARRLLPMAINLASIVAIEALMAAQGIEMRAPLRPGPRAKRALDRVRAISAFLDVDRSLSADIAAMSACIADGRFTADLPEVRSVLPSSE